LSAEFFLFKIPILPTLGLCRPEQPQTLPLPPSSYVPDTNNVEKYSKEILIQSTQEEAKIFSYVFILSIYILSSSYEWKAKMSTGKATLEW
jgi:hypothetical protein